MEDSIAQKNWLRFLSWWSLGTAVAVTCLIVGILTLVMPASDPNPLADKYFELIAAGNEPALYRLTIMFDVLAWIGWGGLFVAFAALLRRKAPVRSMLVALLAAGMTIGFLGASLRIMGTTNLADQYLTATAVQQESIVQSYDSWLNIINITFSAGGLLAGTALLLSASAAKYLPFKLPRWSVALIGLAGIMHIAKAAVELATSSDLGPLALLANVLLIVGLIALFVKSRAAVRS